MKYNRHRKDRFAVQTLRKFILSGWKPQRLKTSKWKIAFTSFCCLILSAVLINYIMIRFSKNYIAEPGDERIKNADCILVLGALVWENGKPSHILEDRILTGIELYRTGVSSALLMSGDHGKKTYDEVNAMKKYAIAKGVPRKCVFTDHAGFSTYDSCYRARDIFCAQKIVIVTQQYHLYRAIYLARSLGLEAYGVASDRRIIYGEKKRLFREFFARVKACGSVFFKPHPAYLGEKIPITTSTGDMTDD